MSAATGHPIPVLVDDYDAGGYGVFKDAVADAVDEVLPRSGRPTPISTTARWPR